MIQVGQKRKTPTQRPGFLCVALRCKLDTLL